MLASAAWSFDALAQFLLGLLALRDVAQDYRVHRRAIDRNASRLRLRTETRRHPHTQRNHIAFKSCRKRCDRRFADAGSRLGLSASESLQERSAPATRRSVGPAGSGTYRAAAGLACTMIRSSLAVRMASTAESNTACAPDFAQGARVEHPVELLRRPNGSPAVR